jgi:hypothetical protein
MQIEVSGFAAALAQERGCISHGDGLAIPLARTRSPVKEWALVSCEDAHLAQFCWSLNDRHRFVRRRGPGGKTVLMHREVLGLVPGDGLDGDHRNHDRTDNRRSNLRPCTRAQNSQNRKGGYRGASSQHRGVSWRKNERKWVATATVGGQDHYLGYFKTEDEAAEAAWRFRAEHMPYTTN